MDSLIGNSQLQYFKNLHHFEILKFFRQTLFIIFQIKILNIPENNKGIKIFLKKY